MDDAGVTRKLAVILAADVAGYARLMAADEEGTLAALNARRRVIDELIARHHGRIFTTAGDSVMAEFASAVEAVRCAAAIQQEVERRNADLPEPGRMLFRVGVNLGDVMIAGDNLFGDGVNVAARLEGTAEPGGICISGAVYDQVRNKVHLSFADLGEQSLKNIGYPVRVFGVRRAAADAESVTERPAGIAPTRATVFPSIAVLPFANLAGDPEQEYFADGITEDLITELSRFQEIRVIARNSVLTYKTKPVRIQEVGRDLGVRYVLEGSVRKAGGRVRITSRSRTRSPAGSWRRSQASSRRASAVARAAVRPRISKPTTACCVAVSCGSASRRRTIAKRGVYTRKRSRSIPTTRARTPASPGPIWWSTANAGGMPMTGRSSGPSSSRAKA
jgi:adenylate cyclase